jgi:hypothetical protein
MDHPVRFKMVARDRIVKIISLISPDYNRKEVVVLKLSAFVPFLFQFNVHSILRGEDYA